MQCNLKNKDGKINGIICGNTGSHCDDNKWCTELSNEKQSYWSTGTFKGDPDCYSKGTLEYNICSYSLHFL